MLIGLKGGTMKTQLFNLLLSSLLSLGWATAMAQTWYIGGGPAGTYIESDGLVSALAQGGVLASGEVEATGFGGQIYAGFLFNDYFGIEIKANASGDAEDTVTVLETGSGITVPVEVTLSSNGLTGYAVGIIPLGNKRFELSGKLGYTYQDGEVEASAFGFSSGTFDDSDNGVAVSALFRYLFTDNWAITGEVEYVGIDFDSSVKEPIRYSVNAEYRF